MSTLAQTRPRSPTEIVDASFQFFKAHAGDLLVLCALLLVPPMLIKAITPAPYNIIFEIATNVMLLVSQGAVAVLVAAALEDDSALTAGEVLRRLGEGRVGNVIVVALMGGILMGLGLILLVIPGIIVAVWLAVSTPVAAIEGRRNSAALGRSRELARGHFWHVALTMLLAWVIFVVLAFGATIVLTLVLAMVGLPERLVELVAGVVLVPLFPLVAVATSLLYFDLRIRREGADMFALADMLPSAPARAEAP